MISKIERVIAFRYLRPKKKEGFLKVISIFSFTGIALGVAILIIVMSVMNGFRTELVNKILGFNPHIIIKPYDKKIHEDDINKLSELSNYITRVSFTFNGQGILINRENTIGILVRSYKTDDIDKIDLIRNGIIDGNLKPFEKNTIFIGKELAISLDLIVGDEVTLMSTSNLQTPFGNLPLQEKFKVSSIFSTGLAEFDQNVIFMPFENANSLFELSDMDINLEIFLHKPDNVQLVKEEIQKIFSDYYVYSWADLNKSFFGALKVERNVMFIILTLIIIVAAFNIISGLTILVKTKTKEIATINPLRIIKISFFFFLEKNSITILIPKRIYTSNIFSTTNDIIKRAKIIKPKINILPDKPSLYKTKINAVYINAVPRSFCKITSRKGNIIIAYILNFSCIDIFFICRLL